MILKRTTRVSFHFLMKSKILRTANWSTAVADTAINNKNIKTLARWTNSGWLFQNMCAGLCVESRGSGDISPDRSSHGTSGPGSQRRNQSIKCVEVCAGYGRTLLLKLAILEKWIYFIWRNAQRGRQAGRQASMIRTCSCCRPPR